MVQAKEVLMQLSLEKEANKYKLSRIVISTLPIHFRDERQHPERTLPKHKIQATDEPFLLPVGDRIQIQGVLQAELLGQVPEGQL
jgi:hypothetical protein